MEKRKTRLFAAGVAALAQVSRPCLQGYLCPLCLKLFDSPDALSEEHAPQRSLGGRSICLTCKPCNSTAGHSIDSAVSREKAHHKLLAKDGTPTRVKLSHGGITLRSEISQKGDFIDIQILRGQNHPRAEADLQQVFDTEHFDGLEFNITAYGGFRRRDADIGYLKTAYLGAFAKFGYSWIFGVDTTPIRSQIQDPSIELLPNCRIGLDPGELQAQQKGFYFMEAPFRAAMASIGSYGIILPWPGGPTPPEISQWVVAQRAQSRSGRLNFVKFAPWPKTSEFVFDLRRAAAPAAS